MRIVLFYCQHAVNDPLDIDPASDRSRGISLRSVMVPCSSKVQVPYLLKILDEEADGIEIVACPERGCRYLTGSRKAAKRVAYARELLEEIGISGERIGLSWKRGLSAQGLVQLAMARAKAVRAAVERGDGR